jgi:hypothetical protein
MVKFAELFKSKETKKAEKLQKSREVINRYVRSQDLDEKSGDKIFSKYIELYNQGSKLEIQDMIDTHLRNKSQN